MTSAEKINTAKSYLRRKYATNVQGLKALAEQVATGAFEAVTITGNGYEGGTAQGQLTFEPMEYLAACEQLIQELDEDAPQPPSLVMHSDFSCRRVET
jgi:hypothetical protein